MPTATAQPVAVVAVALGGSSRCNASVVLLLLIAPLVFCETDGAQTTAHTKRIPGRHPII